MSHFVPFGTCCILKVIVPKNVALFHSRVSPVQLKAEFESSRSIRPFKAMLYDLVHVSTFHT